MRGRREILTGLVIWDLIWKVLAIRRAILNHQLEWAAALLVVNSAGVLPMLYLAGAGKRTTAS